MQQIFLHLLIYLSILSIYSEVKGDDRSLREDIFSLSPVSHAIADASRSDLHADIDISPPGSKTVTVTLKIRSTGRYANLQLPAQKVGITELDVLISNMFEAQGLIDRLQGGGGKLKLRGGRSCAIS